jgi:hypothetical protein
MLISKLAATSLIALLFAFGQTASATVFDVLATNGPQSVPGTGTLSGTITIDTTLGAISAADLTYTSSFVSSAFEGTSVVTALSSPPIYTLFVTGGSYPFGPSTFYDITISDSATAGLVGFLGGLLTFSVQNGDFGVFQTVGGGVGTLTPEVAATPLPAALPLFAGGLGALGLLGWSRKRKTAALAA